MGLHHFDMLRNAVKLADYSNLSEAAAALNMTKGALSQQVRNLEASLGITLFERHAKGMRVTARGQQLLDIARLSFEQIEGAFERAQADIDKCLTIGTTTYFASRWLSPRLMRFMQSCPETRLRIQPMIEPYDLGHSGVDVAIRWGQQGWDGCRSQRLFTCPAWPVGNTRAGSQVEERGAEIAFAGFTLLHDSEDSTAWFDWFASAGMHQNRQKRNALVVPDPYVRVQAVIDGQGVALNDDLVADEIKSGQLQRLHPVQLDRFGYWVAYPADKSPSAEAATFIDWIQAECE